MSKTIICDMDSIVADFYFGILDAHEAETGSHLPHNHIDAWDKTLDGVSMYKYFSKPGFFRTLKPIPGAHRVLKGLHDDGYEIVIATAIAGLGHAPDEKFCWLTEHYPWIHRNTVFMCKDKFRIRGDVFIDDHQDNTSLYMKHNPDALVLGIAYPYNMEHLQDFTHLVGSYLDFEQAWADIDALIRST